MCSMVFYCMLLRVPLQGHISCRLPAAQHWPLESTGSYRSLWGPKGRNWGSQVRSVLPINVPLVCRGPTGPTGNKSALGWPVLATSYQMETCQPCFKNTSWGFMGCLSKFKTSNDPMAKFHRLQSVPGGRSASSPDSGAFPSMKFLDKLQCWLGYWPHLTTWPTINPMQLQ